MRRVFLGAVSAGTISLTGCLNALGETDTVQLNGIVVINALDGPRTLAVLVQRENEIVYWAQHELSGSSCDRTIIKPTWKTAAADFSVAVRLADRKTWTQTPLDTYGGGCIVLTIELLHPGNGPDIIFRDRPCGNFPSPPC